MLPLEPFLAPTSVSLAAITRKTSGSVLTRVVRAAATQLGFTIGASKTRRAFTSVKTLSRVEAEPSVLARLMVCAVV